MSEQSRRDGALEPHSQLSSDWREFQPRVRSHITGDEVSMRGLGFAVPMAAVLWLVGLAMVLLNVWK